MRVRTYRAEHLVQWNARQSKDNPEELVDKVVEAVMHQQGVSFEHTNEYRSVFSYEKLWEQLEHYDRTIVLDKSDSYLRYGLKQAARIFSCPDANKRLKPVSLLGAAADLIGELGIKDKSAGLTAYGETKFQAFQVGLDKAIDILLNGKAPAPCLAGVRTQRKGKTRLVWMYPLEMTIIEAVFMRPLINFRKNTEGVMTFGDYSHEVGMRMRNSINTNRSYVSIDSSQFDSTVSSLFQHRYYDSVRTWFDLDDEIYPGITVGMCIDVAERYAINTGIVMPKRDSKYPVVVDGITGGVKSGSYSTQECDSFTSVSIAFMCSSKFKLRLCDKDIFTLGDDLMWFMSAVRFENEQSIQSFLQKVASFVSNYGFKMNGTKSSAGHATEDIEYLGRRWRNGFPIRKMSEITRGVLYPEHHRRYSDNRADRQQQALNIIGSYLLTAYVENPTCDTDRFNHLYFVTPQMSSGYTEYLLKEGLIPGDVLRRALY